MTKPNSRNVNTLPNGVHRLETGVYLRVSNARRAWIFKYQLNGKRREMGLGGTDQPISAVLGKAAKLRAKVIEGIDPADEKKRRKVAAEKTDPVFSDFVDEFLENLKFTRMFTNNRSFHFWEFRMKAWNRAVGQMKIEDITSEVIANILKDEWKTNPRKGKDRLSAIRTYFSYLVGRGIAKTNPAEWDGRVGRFLPKVSAVMRTLQTNHHPAMSAEDLRSFVQSIKNEEGNVAKVVLIIALTATRAQELRELRWAEVDETECTATVPTERRKDKKPEPFVVPLSRQAMSIIRSIGTTGCEYVFEGEIKGRPVSHDGTYHFIKRKTGFGLHGIRSTFSDWCAKNGKDLLVSEKCLMHAVGGKVFMAYQRNDLLEQRRVLLQEWADFLFGEDRV